MTLALLFILCACDDLKVDYGADTGSLGGSDGGGSGDGGDGGDGGSGDGGATSPAGWSWGSTLTPDDADASLVGTDEEDFAGICVNRAGDLDGDGIQDLAVGALKDPSSKTGRGAVYVVRGRSDGWTDGELLTDHLEIRPGGDLEICEAFAMGDLTGDGRDDLLLDEGWGTVDATTGAWVLAGGERSWTGSLELADLDVAIVPTDENLNSLYVHATVGDFTGDGVADLFFQEWGTSDCGTHVVAGPLEGGSVQLGTDSALELRMGDADTTLDEIGDINGDGRVELLAWRRQNGRLGQTDAVYLQWGGAMVDGSWEEDASLVFEAEDTDARIYGAILPDLDGDGIDELRLTVSDDTSVTYWFFGREAWPDSLDLSDADLVLDWGYHAASINPLADLNADGLVDLAVRIQAVEDGPVTWGIVYGRTDRWVGGLDPTAPDIVLDIASDGVGVLDVRPEHGDLDGDGLPELFLSFSKEDAGGVEDAGRLLVFRGRESWPATLTTADADLTLVGNQENDDVELHEVLDLNGDGWDDLVLGHHYRPDDTRVGEVRIFWGQPFDD